MGGPAKVKAESCSWAVRLPQCTHTPAQASGSLHAEAAALNANLCLVSLTDFLLPQSLHSRVLWPSAQMRKLSPARVQRPPQGSAQGPAGLMSTSSVVENPRPLAGQLSQGLALGQVDCCLWGWAAASTGQTPLQDLGCVPASPGSSTWPPPLRIPLLPSPWPHYRGVILGLVVL